MSEVKDLTGRRFGRLTVLGRSTRRTGSRALHWRCVCDCGRPKDVTGQALRQGLTSSCGCLRAELARERAKRGAMASADKGERARLIDAVLGLAHERRRDDAPKRWLRAAEALSDMERAWR